MKLNSTVIFIIFPLFLLLRFPICCHHHPTDRGSSRHAEGGWWRDVDHCRVESKSLCLNAFRFRAESVKKGIRLSHIIVRKEEQQNEGKKEDHLQIFGDSWEIRKGKRIHSERWLWCHHHLRRHSESGSMLMKTAESYFEGIPLIPSFFLIKRLQFKGGFNNGSLEKKVVVVSVVKEWIQSSGLDTDSDWVWLWLPLY